MRKILFVLFLFPFVIYGQSFGLRNNVLYDMTTTPNMGIDVRVENHFTFSVYASYNPFIFKSNGNTLDRKLTHWKVTPEFKYWFGKAFQQNFVGIHGIYTNFDIGGFNFPKFLKDYRYDGWGIGAGVSWGYQWAIGDAWGCEVSFGIGYIYFRYDKYDEIDVNSLGKFKNNYIGPTKIDISLIYYF